MEALTAETAKSDPWVKKEMNQWIAKLRTGKYWTKIDVNRTAQIGLAALTYADDDHKHTLMRMILRWEKAGPISMAEIIHRIHVRANSYPRI